MALSTPYCTLLNLQDETKNNDADSDAAALTRHEDAINTASRMVEEWTHRDFTIHDHSSTALTVAEKYIAQDSIYLPWPVLTLTEITVDGTVLPTDEWKQVGSYEIRRIEDWPSIPFDDATFIQIKGTFGYLHPDLTTIPTGLPATVQRATTIIAATISGDYRKDLMDRDGGVQQIGVTDIPKEAKMLLRKFRRRFF